MPKVSGWFVTTAMVVIVLAAAPALPFTPWRVAKAQARLGQSLAKSTIPNDLIDYDGFRAIVDSAEVGRESKRLTEAEFLDAMSKPDTVLLDARSAKRFEQRHIAGAVNLPFTDWTQTTLSTVIANSRTRILIYCNNNFVGSPESFPTKLSATSLNLMSYTNLVAYGYTNIYELGPLLDVASTILPFDGRELSGLSPARAPA